MSLAPWLKQVGRNPDHLRDGAVGEGDPAGKMIENEQAGPH